MLLTFCGVFDVLHRKKEDKVVPAMVDLRKENTVGVDSSDQVMHSYAFEWRENHGQKKPSYMPSNEFLYTL